MATGSAVSALADVTATLVDDYDVVSTLTGLTRSCVDVLGASACGVLVGIGERADGSGVPALELLAASSHGAGELELYQLQVGEGPCLDAVARNAVVSVSGPERMVEHWPQLGRALVEAGMGSAHGFPLRWRGRAFGALNVFTADERRFGADEDAAARAFADVAAIAIVHARDVPRIQALAGEIETALAGRTVIERAKGVLAVQEGVDAAEAFQLLLAHAGVHGRSLAAVAAEVLERAERGRHWSRG